MGINHRTAPIAIREKAAVRMGKLHDALPLLRAYIPHGIILSTCNRTEVYTANSDSRYAEEASLNFLKAHFDISETDLLQCAYFSKNEEAVEHLFRIACGLDSIVVGEFEILGQVRQALETAKEAGMRNRPELPMVIIDIAVPRNVEPAVEQINNVFLYNINDLTQISDANRRQREGEVQKAGEIIAAEVAKFASWRQAFEVRPVLGALMRKTEDIRRSQLNKTLKKLRPLSDEERDSLDAMTKSIATKILQEPIQYLKGKANNNENYAEIVRQLFQLDMERRE